MRSSKASTTMKTPPDPVAVPVTFRPAIRADAQALMEFERDTDLAGLARQAVARASGVRRLWCLAENHRARGFHEHLGWRATGRNHLAEWPPYPTELEYAR
jgi:hypothetical protein